MNRPPFNSMAFNRPTHRMPQMPQHFQRNTNCVPSRGPGYGYYPRFRGPPQALSQSRNDEYWCETCDRGFRTADMLESHKKQHQKCKIDGCQFIAHPKVITKHIQMQHSTGIFKKIGNLSKPEDIERWREERKKKYPTKENIEKKAAELKEKIQRGEKMGLKKDMRIKNGESYKRKHSNNFGYNDDNNRKRKNANPTITTDNNNKQTKRKRKEQMLPPPENVRTLKPFAGIQNLIMDIESEILEDQHYNDQIEDDDDCLLEQKIQNMSSQSGMPSVCGALSTLMCEYGSSDEEIEQTSKKASDILIKIEKPKLHNVNMNQTEMPTNNVHNKEVQLEKNTDAEHINDDVDDCPPEEVKVEKPIENKADYESVCKKTEKTKRMKNCSVRKPQRKLKPKLPSTLLQKLLHREIQQERNIVLQCIRYIVKNNYFDK